VHVGDLIIRRVLKRSSWIINLGCREINDQVGFRGLLKNENRLFAPDPIHHWQAAQFFHNPRQVDAVVDGDYKLDSRYAAILFS